MTTHSPAPMARPDLATLPWWAHWMGDERLHLLIWTGSPCCGCGVNIHEAHEYYHVHNGVWAEAGACKRSLLCIGCLEDRLGRELTRADFSDAGVNHDEYYRYPVGTRQRRIRSARFADRLARTSAPI